MKTTFTWKEMISSRGCYPKYQIILLLLISLKWRKIRLEDIIDSNIPIQDKLWFIYNNCNFDYDKRAECFSQSGWLKDFFSAGGLVGVDYWVYFLDCSGGFYSLEAKTRILQEILKYSKS